MNSLGLDQIIHEPMSFIEAQTGDENVRANFKVAIEAYIDSKIIEARVDELESLGRVYNSLPELHNARENTCIALFARLRQLKPLNHRKDKDE